MEEGTLIGGYRVLRQIGEGGMGSVWLAEHAMLQRRAAIKVLHPELSGRAEIVQRFFNEARAATSVQDPGIVQIFDFGNHADGSAYIVMELLDGESLDQRLARRGALELPETLRIMRQVASTLGAVHAKGITHRDLKPENIFVVPDREVAGGERAKILDFGIAKLAGDHGGVKTKTKAVMGTPLYMSPEQCRGAGLVDQRSDVYALGCVMFALLVGRPPFDSEGAGELLVMHLREPPPVPSSLRPGIPPAIDQLVLRCLAKDPAQRFAHGGELADAIGSLLGSLAELGALAPSAGYRTPAVTTLSASSGASLAAPAARSRRTIAFAAVGAIAGGGAIAAIVMSSGSESSRRATEPGSAAASQGPADPTATPATATPATATPPTPAPQEPDPALRVAAGMKDVLTRFVAWSREHRGERCPDAAALGDLPRDPWGRAFTLTCTEQPEDQIVGAISAGPDGAPGTADDLASWKLGRDLTELARGPRWGTTIMSAPVPSVEQPRPKPRPKLNPEPESKPKADPKPKPPSEPGPRIEFDENGIPIKR